MWEKIKAFFKNKIVITVEFVIIGICCAGLIIAGITVEEIAKEMNMPVERVREILKISQEPVSLETPIGEEEDSHLGDFIPDEDVPAPAEAAGTAPPPQPLSARQTFLPLPPPPAWSAGGRCWRM